MQDLSTRTTVPSNKAHEPEELGTAEPTGGCWTSATRSAGSMLATLSRAPLSASAVLTTTAVDADDVYGVRGEARHPRWAVWCRCMVDLRKDADAARASSCRPRGAEADGHARSTKCRFMLVPHGSRGQSGSGIAGGGAPHLRRTEGADNAIVHRTHRAVAALESLFEVPPWRASRQPRSERALLDRVGLPGRDEQSLRQMPNTTRCTAPGR